MSDIIKFLYDLLQKILNNDNYVNFLGIIIVAITSYHVAKYNTFKPNKLKIKQLQFEKIYLPLYRVLIDTPDEPTTVEILQIHKKITNILNTHYELAFPQLHKLNKSMGRTIAKRQNYTKDFLAIKHQVIIDYELLKKTLGYPSETFYNIFIRMSLKRKLKTLLPLFSWTVSCLPIIFIYQADSHSLFTLILLYIIEAIIVIFARIFIDNMKD